MNLKGDGYLKRIYWALLFILLFPVLAFAEDSKVTFFPSDTQLQGKPAVTLKAPYFSIMLPSYLEFTTAPPSYDMTVVEGNSPDGDFKIDILTSEKSQFYEMLAGAIKNNRMLTNKQIENVAFSGVTGIKVTGFVDMINRSYQQITYVLSSNGKTVSITACINPENYESYLPLIDEIMNTLKTDNTKATFLQTDVTLQGKSAIVCETPHYQILFPKEWSFKTNILKFPGETEDVIEVIGNSPDNHIIINAFDTFPGTHNLAKEEESLNKDSSIEKKQVKKFSHLDAEGLMWSGLFFIDNDLHYQVTYDFNRKNKAFSVIARINPENYDKDLVLVKEIINTLKFKN